MAAAMLAPVAVCALLSLLRGLITNNNAALVLVLVVVAVAATGRRIAGLVAAVVSAASFDFFLTRVVPGGSVPAAVGRAADGGAAGPGRS